MSDQYTYKGREHGITAPADVLPTNGVKPSAGTMLSEKLVSHAPSNFRDFHWFDIFTDRLCHPK